MILPALAVRTAKGIDLIHAAQPFPFRLEQARWVMQFTYIDGKAAGPVSRDQLRRMLATLLADRFRLAMHRETKDIAAYALVIGKNGHKLRETAGGPGAGLPPKAACRGGSR